MAIGQWPGLRIDRSVTSGLVSERMAVSHSLSTHLAPGCT